MWILALCIFCNVLLAVIFKGFAKYRVDNLNAIIVNYIVCVVVASLFLGQTAIPLDLLSRPWVRHAFILAALFIVGFNVMALAFQHCGVAMTVIWQKMSLIIPAAFAIALYGETLNLLKGVGIFLAMTAIVLVNLPEKPSDKSIIRLTVQLYLYLVLIWLLSGMIEVLLFFVQVEMLVTDDIIEFTATSFAMAAMIGLVYSVILFFRTRRFIGKKEIIGGIVLGIPNFMTIYLLLLLLFAGWEGSVLFPMNNVGILLFTALVGVMFFHEKLNRMKTIGLFLAATAILLIGMS